MNIFNKAALQNMRKSRTRTLVTVVGVALSAAMITAVATFGVSLMNFLVKGSAVKYGDWHVAFSDVDASFVRERAQDSEVISAAAFENVGYATLEGGQSPEKPYLFIAGFSEEAFDALPVNLISGRLPETCGEILIPAHVAIKGGVRFELGDTLSLAVGNRVGADKTPVGTPPYISGKEIPGTARAAEIGGVKFPAAGIPSLAGLAAGNRAGGNGNLGQHDPYISGKETLAQEAERSYTVVGICERPAFEEQSAPGYTLITKADAANPATGLSLFVTLKNPRNVHAYAERTAGGHSTRFNDDVLRFMGASDNGVFNALLYSVGGILVALIMVGSVFLIYNAFNISLNERARQFGILSSVGATARQLRNSVLFEGLCIGGIGIPIGILAGIGSIGLVIPVVAGNFGDILYSTVPLTLSVSVPSLAAAAAVSMVTILISAYIPARKAANTPVMECIRQTNEIKTESKAVKTSKRAERVYGLEGTIALKNFKRNKKRYRNIVLSLTLSVVLFVSASAFGTHLKELSGRAVVDIDGDILFSTGDMSEGEALRLYGELQTAEGVYESSHQAILSYSCAANASDFSDRYREYAGYSAPGEPDMTDEQNAPNETVNLPMDIQFIEDGEYLRFIGELGLPAEEYTGQDAKMIAVAKERNAGESGVFDIFKESAGTFTVSPEANDMPMTEQGQSVSLTFVDTYPIDPPPSQSAEPQTTVFMAVAPYSLKAGFTTPDTRALMGMAFLSENPARSAAEMETMIQGAGITALYSLYNVHSMLEQSRSILFVIDVFTYVFVIMISLIAVANVFNTISTNIKLRRRELAMLRSVGMSDRDFQKMMNFECAFYGMRTLLFGIPIAAGLSWLIYKGLMSVERLDNFNFMFPWDSMAISVCGVFLIVFITMLYAIRKIKKENIIDALRDDMT